MLVLLISVAYFILGRVTFSGNTQIRPLWVLIFELFIICGMLCVPYKAMGNFGQNRLINIVWMTFMIFSAFLWVYYLVWSNLVNSLKHATLSKYWRIIILISGAVLLFYSSSNFMDYFELLLKGEATEYFVIRF